MTDNAMTDNAMTDEELVADVKEKVRALNLALFELAKKNITPTLSVGETHTRTKIRDTTVFRVNLAKFTKTL